MFQKVKQNPRQVLDSLKFRALNSFRYSGYRRFIVLTRSRTGSNLLVSFLNSHPNISAEGELFNRLNGRNYEKILATVFASQPYQTKAKGFKIFYYHPNDDDASKLWHDLVNMDNLYVIHLKRRNILRTLVSRKIAELRRQWQVVDSSDIESKQKRRVRLTVEELLNGFQSTRNWESAGDEMFSEHPLMPVYYENLVEEPEAIFEEISGFLGVRYVQPQTPLKKQNPEKTSELVVNFEELKDAFTGTEWQPFFEES